jgi:hypothetical protein
MDDSEAWLHHYMLGKIAEKLKKSPDIYLEHYGKVTVPPHSHNRLQNLVRMNTSLEFPNHSFRYFEEKYLQKKYFFPQLHMT